MEQKSGSIQPCSDEEQDHEDAHHGRSHEEEDGHWDRSDHNLLSNVKKTSTRINFDEGEGGRREHWSALECYFTALATLWLQLITKPCVWIL